MDLGYLGPEGSHSYSAAKHYAPHKRLIGMQSFGQIISAVEGETLSQGILPIENSTEGAVTQAMDGLLGTEKVRIQGEIILRIQHNLLSTGTDPASLRYVMSHPQAIEQCREYFALRHPEIKLIPCESTSKACFLAKEKGPEYGAIAQVGAAAYNGLNVLHENIQDNIHNQTRFVIIGRESTGETGKDKTSIAFSFQSDSAGCLHEVLKVFADANVNLTRIESRPEKIELGKYIFYVDFHGHEREIKTRIILDQVRQRTSMLKVFGSYPKGQVI
ncbi:MAG: prephenate dehydratase [Bacillota bacterium]|nr:prephenate dehydratase [Bacillota bacterium]HHU61689.1 prephenate dehydratase [Natronincola sp.]